MLLANFIMFIFSNSPLHEMKRRDLSKEEEMNDVEEYNDEEIPVEEYEEEPA